MQNGYENQYKKILIAVILGFIVGCIALIYNKFLDYIIIKILYLNNLQSLTFRIISIFFPALGGLIVGYMIKYGSITAKGHGIPAILASIKSRERHLTYKDLLTEGFASAVTISSGGSAGRIGPIVEIGAGIGDLIGFKLNYTLYDYQTLLGCGAAAGVAGLFHAPLGGIMFATEILFNKIEKNRLIMLTISAVSADMIIILNSDSLFLPKLNFNIPDIRFGFISIFIGLFAAIPGVLFICSLKLSEELFSKLKFKDILKPAAGGLAVGITAFFIPDILGSGSQIIVQLYKHPNYLMRGLILVMVFKIIATALTLGSGGSGGIFSPSLLIGLTYGLLIEKIINIIFPFLCISIQLYALVGMAAVLSAVIRAPLTSAFIIAEFTHNYALILPLLIAALTAERSANLSGLKSAYSPEYFKRFY
ncbi:MULTISPECIES: chloride channel protein [unclassified Halanaerobium]|uniref:chloride channel protein n=1 Tax=unclassified Halanaerobium TaxID=2641197 RepID=UPI000DF2ADF2|nr:MULTISPECIES: chloride channel protein [unclassified Halanaerobium]RCW51497.1 CIC family chloride channel protein [Halanaerobium sp. MA284_MarDTE_T2]RCW89285.1 CIC family chloride channel protein [Halanaerobium sp. DL-01]